MKPKIGKYLVNPPRPSRRRRRANPVPFSMIVANPRRKKRSKNPGLMTPTAHEKSEWSRLAKDAYKKGFSEIGHRFSAAAALRAGESMPIQRFDALQRDYRSWLIDGFTRNPVRARSASPGIFIVRRPKKNPSMKTRRRKKRRNPISNLGKFAKRRRRKSSARRSRRNTARRRLKRRSGAKIFIVNPMSKNKRRRGSRRRSRNPLSRRRRSGNRSARRRMRNPLPVVRELFSNDNLSLAAGMVVSSVGTTMLMNRLLAGNPAAGAAGRPFNLPGIDYTALASPATAAQFYAQNAWAIAAYKLVIGGVAGYALRNQSPRLARGIMIGSVATAISDVLRNTGVLSASGTLAGVGRGTRAFLPRGAGTYIPGVPSILSGPGTQFINNGAPVMRRGMGATVNPRWMQATTTGVADPFRPN